MVDSVRAQHRTDALVGLEERLRALELEVAALKTSVDAWRQHYEEVFHHQENYYKKLALVTTTGVSTIVALLVQIANLLIR